MFSKLAISAEEVIEFAIGIVSGINKYY